MVTTQWVEPIFKESALFLVVFSCISWVINHMTCYNFECSHWSWNYIISDWRANLVKDFFRYQANESTRIITGHVIYKLAYTYKFQLKITFMLLQFRKTFLKHSYSMYMIKGNWVITYTYLIQIQWPETFLIFFSIEN